jgi:hypothetical protein
MPREITQCMASPRWYDDGNRAGVAALLEAVAPVMFPTSCQSSPTNVHDAIRSFIDHSSLPARES